MTTEPSRSGGTDVTTPAGDDVERRWDRRYWRGMGAIVALGAVLRLVYKATSNQDLLTGLSGDGWFYQAAAQRLAEGMGFVSVLGETRPFAGFPPMWTSVLGLGAWLGADSIWSMRLIAIGVGLVTILLVGMAARQLGGSRAGLVAAGIAALYPGLWYYEWSLLSETLVHLGIALFLVLCYRFWAHPTALRAALVGGSVGLLALTRAEGLLLAPLVVVPLLLLARTAPVERRLGWLVLAGAVTLAMLTPWFAYNLGRFEEPVLLSNGLGTAMYVSNCDATYSGELLGYYANPGCPEEHRGRPGHVVSGDQSEQDRAKRRVAIDYATDHPQRLPVVVAARVGRSIGVYRPVQTMDFQVDWSLVPRWVGTWWMVGYGVVAAAAIPGLVRVRRSGLPVFPLVAFLVIVVAGSALTFGSIRYRAALEVPLVVLAGVGIDGLLRSRAERWPRRSGASPPLV